MIVTLTILTFQFTMYYHMYGSDVRNLRVYARQYKDSNYGDIVLMSSSGGSGNDAWRRADIVVNIPSGTPFQVSSWNFCRKIAMYSLRVTSKSIILDALSKNKTTQTKNKYLRA